MSRTKYHSIAFIIFLCGSVCAPAAAQEAVPASATLAAPIDEDISRLPTGDPSLLRRDYTEVLAAALRKTDTKALIDLMRDSSRSTLDMFLFLITAVEIIQDEPALMNRFSLMVDRMYNDSLLEEEAQEIQHRYIPNLQAAVEKQYSRNREEVYSADRNVRFIDVTSGTFFSLAMLHNTVSSFTDTMLLRMIHDALLQNDGAFLLSVVRHETGNPRLALQDITFPVRVTQAQEGKYQHVYSLFVTLRDGTVVPFILMIPRDAEYNDVIHNEYTNLARYRGAPEVTYMLAETKIVFRDTEIPVYASRYLNGYSEVTFVPYRKKLLFLLEKRLTFRVNSSLPHHIGFVESMSAGFPKILSSMVTLLTYFYDPTAQAMIGKVHVNAGDFNFNDAAFRAMGPYECFFEPEFRDNEAPVVRLIAWRSTVTQVDIPAFIDYLCSLQYLIDEPEDLLEETFLKEFISLAVLKGIEGGMVKKYGESPSTSRLVIAWLTQYRDSLDTGRFRESPIITRKAISNYIENLQSFLTDVQPDEGGPLKSA